MGHGSGALPRIQTGHPELQMRQVIHRKAIGLGLMILIPPILLSIGLTM
jgi:hypothetical protein|nr:MAG TPA: hypothetical protein [Caudoviricetes sp.]